MPRVFAGSAAYPSPSPRPVLTIGNFDGVHQGHRSLIDAVVLRAVEMEAPACVYTFDPPPRVVLAPDQHRPRIQPWTDRVQDLGQLGVDHVILERFTQAFAQHPPEWFVHEILSRRIQPRAMVVGYDFRFGRDRGGTVDFLRQRLGGIEIHQVSAHEIASEVVSSSRIRQAVESGRVAEAAELLGRLHIVRGVVRRGEGRGRGLGFPTANIHTVADLLPAPGVYAVRARVDGGPWRCGVANLGTRPTFGGQELSLEVHLLETDQDLYGRELEVGFVDRLRGEQRFDGPEELIAQIRNDVVQAEQLLGLVPS
jgi:riboflavin kinase/FMN adenylyltransferase